MFFAPLGALVWVHSKKSSACVRACIKNGTFMLVYEHALRSFWVLLDKQLFPIFKNDPGEVLKTRVHEPSRKSLFFRKMQKCSGTVSEGKTKNIAKLTSPGQCDFRKNAKS